MSPEAPVGPPVSGIPSVVHIASGDLWAGAEVQVFNLVKGLRRVSGLRVSAILMNHGVLEQRLRGAGIDVKVVDETRVGKWRALGLVARYLWTAKPDIVHTHRQKENVLGAWASALLPGAVSLRTAHGADETTVRNWELAKLLYRFLDRVSGQYLQEAVVAVSDELKKTYLDQMFSREKVSVIANGIDIDDTLERAKQAVDIPGPAEAFKIAFVGRLVAVKRPDFFLQVAQLVASERSDVTFFMFGDGPLQSRLQEELRYHGLEARLFLMGFRENMPAYIAAMDMLLITSDHEGFPMVVLEAMALQVPVVARAVGGIPVLLDNGRYGLPVGDQPPEGLADTVRNALQHRKALSVIAQRAYARVMQHYSAEVCAARYAELYRQLIHSRKGISKDVLP